MQMRMRMKVPYRTKNSRNHLLKKKIKKCVLHVFASNLLALQLIGSSAISASSGIIKFVLTWPVNRLMWITFTAHLARRNVRPYVAAPNLWPYPTLLTVNRCFFVWGLFKSNRLEDCLNDYYAASWDSSLDFHMSLHHLPFPIFPALGGSCSPCLYHCSITVINTSSENWLMI